MATGYSSIVVAEARERLSNLLRGIDGVSKLQRQARENEQYNINASALYVAARHDLLAIQTDFDIFKKFIDDNRDKLYGNEAEYYAYKVDNIRMQLDYLTDTIVIPSLVTPVIPAGSTDNDDAVGVSFPAVITKVSDGDTVTVEQILSTAGISPLSHVVRIAGIDCPESGTTRGKMVRAATEAFWLGKEVTVYYDRHTPNDLYGRVLGTIYYDDINFAIWSLEHCFTEPNLKFGKNHYVDGVEMKQAVKRCVISWPQLGKIRIITKPTHASVYLGKVGGDDSDLRVSRGNTPLELEIPVGDYVLILASPGLSSLRDVITVTDQEVILPPYVLPSDSDSSVVRISTDPFDVRGIVSVDGDIIGIAPLNISLSNTDSHEIVVAADGYGVYTETIVLSRDGGVKNVVAKLHVS